MKSLTNTPWKVEHTGQAKKALRGISEDTPEDGHSKYLSKDARRSYALLLGELKILGPQRDNWPNFTKMHGKNDDYHCHIERGRPTYVACWRADKKNKLIEVYYVGTHENSPY